MRCFFIFMLFICFGRLVVFGQTGIRHDAGLRGDAGAVSGFFETSTPLNYPSFATTWWHLLDVRHSNTTNNYAMQFSGSFFDQNLYFRKTNNNPAQVWSRVLLELNGKVGIGTLNPTHALTVDGDIGLLYRQNAYLINYSSLSETQGGATTVIGNNVRAGLGSNTVFKTIQTNDPGTYMALNYYHSITFHTGLNSPLNTEVALAQQERMRITQGGNVGIGTSGPESKLTVKGENATVDVQSTASGQGIR